MRNVFPLGPSIDGHHHSSLAPANKRRQALFCQERGTMDFVGLNAREPKNLWLIIFNGTVYLVVMGYNAGGNARG